MLSSLTHLGGAMKLEDLQATHRYSGFRSYANSKLATILGVKEFQRRINRFGRQWHIGNSQVLLFLLLCFLQSLTKSPRNTADALRFLRMP